MVYCSFKCTVFQVFSPSSIQVPNAHEFMWSVVERCHPRHIELSAKSDINQAGDIFPTFCFRALKSSSWSSLVEIH